MGFIGKQPAKAAITSSDITDGVVTTDKIAADAVTDAKIADDVVGSEHLTAGEVDTTALGADAVTAAKIADDAISEEHLDVTAVTGHTAETSVANDDTVLIHDTSASALKKMTVSNLTANAGTAGLTSSSGHITITDGDLIFGGSGHGVYLGVTSATAANHLGDYEEGTWTPVVKNGSTGGTTMAIYSGVYSYTKIGRIVNVQFTIRRNDSASLTDVLLITGLPFSATSSGMDANTNGTMWVDNSSGDKVCIINIGAGNSHMAFRQTSSPDSSLACDELGNGRYLYGSATYITDA